MEIKCIKTMEPYWGITFEEGKYYKILKIENRNVEVTLDYEKYFHYCSKVASSVDWIRKGYTEENLHEVIPDYMPYKEMRERFVKTISIPYVYIKGDNGDTESFYIMSDEDIMKKYNLDEKSISTGRREGRLHFQTTEDAIDEYFEWPEFIREEKLNGLGIW